VTRALTRHASSLFVDAWRYVTADDAVEYYAADGSLLRVMRRGGFVFTLQHSGGRLRSVSDPFGRTLQFAYNADNRLERVTTPEGTTIEYGFGSAPALGEVRYPDGTSRKYLYENAAYPLALTGIIDERGVRYVTWAYDVQGRAVSSEYAGGVQRHQLEYNPDGTVKTIDPLGTSRIQRYALAGTSPVFAGQSQPCANCTGDAANQTIDSATGLPLETIDYLGVSTLFALDTQRALTTSVTQAAGRPEQRQIQVEWHPTLRVPALVKEPGRRVAYTYDALGNELSMTVTDTSNGASRTWLKTYTASALLETMTDPKGGVWRYAHDALGNRTAVTDPLGQVTRYTYDAGGRMATATDPLGLVTRYGYDARGRLVSEDFGGEVSTFRFTPDSKLAAVVRPNGHEVTYNYDSAQRLIGANDNRGARISYTLDAAGNRIREEVADARGTIALVTARVVNSLSRVAAIQGGTGQTTQIGYDANGQPVSQTDPLNQTTRRSLDALRRTVATIYPDNELAAASWNQRDQLTQVTDPKGVATRYAYNAFGEVISETSPDIGRILYTRDKLGNVVFVEDANGRIARIERDALGEPVRIEYATTNVTSFEYDAARRVKRMEDASGTTTYTRDLLGRIIGETQSVNDNTRNPSTYKVGYAYTGGDLTSVTYPSGLKVTYRRAAGRIVGVDVQVSSSSAAPFVHGIEYTALGQPKSWAWRSGDLASRTFDADGRMVSSELGTYRYDAAGRMVGITQNLWAHQSGRNGKLHQVPVSWTVGYDSRNRVTSFVREGADVRYTYDANGNRLSAVTSVTGDTDLDGSFERDKKVLSAKQTLDIEATSNRLLGFKQTITLGEDGKKRGETNAPVRYTVDASGALTNDGLRDLEYDERGRLSRVSMFKEFDLAAVEYLHNGLGQRVFKSDMRHGKGSPREEELGKGFVDWLKGRFGWLFNPQSKDKAVIGQAFVYGDGEIPPWALLGEYDNGSAIGKGRSEYIWLPTEDGSAILVGMYRGGSFYAVHSDHLGTPRLVTESRGTPVWQWAYSAFGDDAPIDTLMAAAVGGRSVLKAKKPTVEVNLRFPGQYSDEESGLAYNYIRSYQALHGRYAQADPIGLAGGLNRFTYVNGDPISYADPTGLIPCPMCVGAVVGGAFGGYTAWSTGGNFWAGAAIGAAGGAVGNFAVGGLAGTVGAGVVGGAIGGLAGPVSKGEPPTTNDILFGAGMGGLAGPLGPGFKAVMGNGGEGAGAAVGGTLTGIADVVNGSTSRRRDMYKPQPQSCPRM
jgi:RHS repeat-associated protein